MFADRLRDARIAANLTGRAVADALAITPAAYSGWEHGKREPSFEMLVRLCRLLHVSADYLLGLTDAPGGAQLPPLSVSIPRASDPLADLTPDERSQALGYIARIRDEKRAAGA